MDKLVIVALWFGCFLTIGNERTKLLKTKNKRIEKYYLLAPGR